MVRDKRLELLRRKALDPKSSVSANSTNLAYGAQEGTWTLTIINPGILSPVRLPIPPLEHVIYSI